MVVVTLYYRGNDPASQQTLEDLDQIQKEVPFQFVKVDVSTDSGLDSAYGSNIPVVKVGPYQLRPPISAQDLLVSIKAANDRADHLTRVADEAYKEKLERGHTLTRADRFTFWLSKHYMALFNLILFIYAGVPWLAPVFMKIGAEIPAKVIYAVYSPLCHQLAYRSWFLFGQQAAYPLELAHVPGLITYEQISNNTGNDLVAAREFNGNNLVGYKVAICERDSAIYISILVFGLIFSIARKWIKVIPWYLWVIIGIIPIALDGGTQLLGNIATSLSINFPIRESTPFLRTLTGSLFGLLTAWYLYPVIEDSMKETRIWLTQKVKIVEELKSQGGKGV